MADISEIVSVSITSATVQPSRQGFGTPLIVGKHDVWPGGDVRTYRSESAMIADGFVSGEPVMVEARALFSQNPRPPSIKVAKAFTDSVAQTFDLTVYNTEDGETYSVTIVGPDGTETVCSYTRTNPDDDDAVAAALAALINAIAGITAAAVATNVITCTADNVGEIWRARNMTATILSGVYFLADRTADMGYDTDLASIFQLDSDWWALSIAGAESLANVTAIAAWAEANERFYMADVYGTDAAIVGGSGTHGAEDIGVAMAALNYDFTSIVFGGYVDYGVPIAAAWLGAALPSDPGSITWAHMQLAGVAAYPLDDTTRAALFAAGVNTYETISGLSVTRYGTVASGEWIDAVRGDAWLKARIAERVFALLVASPKVPFTDDGADLLKAEVAAQLRIGVDRNVLAADPEPVVTAPLVADVDVADRQNRHFPDVMFTATRAGAIHTVTIEGTISV